MKKKSGKIVVMGGSFNPPTVAHYVLMKLAVEKLGADTGYFVPVSDAYLKRKMMKSGESVILSPALRVKMLRAMCTDERLQVCEKEIGTVEARTLPTLREIQAENPEADIFFVMGADKLGLLRLLTERHGFLDEFRVVLYGRDGFRAGEAIRNDDILSKYAGRFTFISTPEEISGVSSSQVRARMLAGESTDASLCPGVRELFKGFKASDFPEIITRFRDEYDFLSNSFRCDVEREGIIYESAETAFLLSRAEDEETRRQFARCRASTARKKFGNPTPAPGREETELRIMEDILREKFRRNPELLDALAATGNRILIDGSKHKDTFWGVDLYTRRGENHTGRLLMKIRDEYNLKRN